MEAGDLVTRAETSWESGRRDCGESSRVAVGVASHRSHRSGRAQLRHPVRPVKDSLSRFAIRRRYVDPLPGSKAPDGLPSYGSLTDIPLPSPGSPRYRFPCFVGTMKMCDSRRPSHRASFPSRGDTMRGVCRFAPVGPRRQTAGQGCIIRSPPPEWSAWKRSGYPRFLGNPLCLCPVLRPRQDRRIRPSRCADMAPVQATTKAPSER